MKKYIALLVLAGAAFLVFMPAPAPAWEDMTTVCNGTSAVSLTCSTKTDTTLWQNVPEKIDTVDVYYKHVYQTNSFPRCSLIIEAKMPNGGLTKSWVAKAVADSTDTMHVYRIAVDYWNINQWRAIIRSWKDTTHTFLYYRNR